MSNSEIIGMLRLELAETLGRLGEVERLNQRLLESQRRVYVATKPVLEAVKSLRDVDRSDPLAVMLTTSDLIRAYNTFNPPREWESYK